MDRMPLVKELLAIARGNAYRPFHSWITFVLSVASDFHGSLYRLEALAMLIDIRFKPVRGFFINSESCIHRLDEGNVTKIIIFRDVFLLIIFIDADMETFDGGAEEILEPS